MIKKEYVTADQIGSVKCDKDCQEVAINFLRDDKIAVMTVTDNTMITKLKKLVEKDPDNYKCYICSRDPDTGEPHGYIFEFPKKCLSFRAVSTKKRTMTEEQRKAVAARFKKNKS